MAETSTIFGFMKYVSATDILSDFKKTVDSHFVNSLMEVASTSKLNHYLSFIHPSTNTKIAKIISPSFLDHNNDIQPFQISSLFLKMIKLFFFIAIFLKHYTANLVIFFN